MLYAMLCYHDEGEVNAWTREEVDALLAKRAAVTDRLAAEGKLKPSVGLMPTTTAVSVRSGTRPVVLDGPFAETKEQLLGLYVVDCETFDEAVSVAQEIVRGETGTLEVRPVRSYNQGSS